jgi:ribosomal protein L32
VRESLLRKDIEVGPYACSIRFEDEPPIGGGDNCHGCQGDAKAASVMCISCETYTLRHTISMICVSVLPTIVFLPLYRVYSSQRKVISRILIYNLLSIRATSLTSNITRLVV